MLCAKAPLLLKKGVQIFPIFTQSSSASSSLSSSPSIYLFWEVRVLRVRRHTPCGTFHGLHSPNTYLAHTQALPNTKPLSSAMLALKVLLLNPVKAHQRASFLARLSLNKHHHEEQIRRREILLSVSINWISSRYIDIWYNSKSKQYLEFGYVSVSAAKVLKEVTGWNERRSIRYG